jgi:dTDP-glucose 4,6-dehydratase
VTTVDALTYAGSLESLEAVLGHPRHSFVCADIGDAAAMRCIFQLHRPDRVMHLAAETHVDRSIGTPAPFITTNVVGTFAILEAARAYWQDLDDAEKARFRLLQVSTDEVYGTLGATGHFTEDSPYRPNSPYAAAKAGADHLLRAWHRTFGLPALLTHCSNNFGPYQYPEKLLPVLVLNALAGRTLPVYGTGANIRDWIHVDDHVEALMQVLTRGRSGETYDIGGGNECSNLDLARQVCTILDDLLPDSPNRPHAALISFVADRPGHDHRYAVDPAKIRRELGWQPRRPFDGALRQTVRWYVDNQDWCRQVLCRNAGQAEAAAAPPRQ